MNDSRDTPVNGAGAKPGAIPATRAALDAVLPTVYAELRDLAEKTMGANARRLTIQPTALVHEAFVRLSRERQGWADRNHFVVAAAVAMRRALVDHIRSRQADKRGGGRRTEFDIAMLEIEDRRFEVLAVEDTLRQLEAEDADAAQVAELRIFGGLSGVECASALGVSTKTIQRRWRFARAWLVAAMEGKEPA